MSKCPQLVSALAVASACAALVLPAPAAAAGSTAGFTWDPEARLEVVGTPRDAGARGAEMRDLQQNLAAARVEQAMAREIVVELDAAERQLVDTPTPGDGRYLVGVAKAVGVEARGAGAARAAGDGLVWTAAVRSPGATALRLHLTGVDLPRGAELYVYNLDGQAFGPYTGRGPNGNGVVYTHTVAGDRILLQLHQPDGAAAVPAFRIEGVGVMGERFVLPRFGPEGALDGNDLAEVAEASNLCSYNADCVVNAACQSSGAVADAKQAVATMLFASAGGYYICTGGLVADTDDGGVIPYFLTANHCISTNNEASSLETYFDYTTTCNSPNCTQPYNNTGETVGATLLAHSSQTDFSLMQLSSTPVTADGTTAYLGWLTTPVANTHNVQLYRISHPQGAPQAYSEQRVDTTKVTCQGLNRGNFIYSKDNLGATEGGSSGSPVVNIDGQIVGQLYGACGFNINDVCDADSNATVDGAFAVTYPNVDQWLNPDGGGGDPPPPACLPPGDPCTENSDCCSNRCKGKRTNKTCR